MCDAEDELRRAERDIEGWRNKLDLVVELAGDVERGIITLAEFRDQAERISGAKASMYA